MPYRRRRRSTRSMPRQVIQSFKKVINIAPISRVGGTPVSLNLSVGTDSVAAGQIGPTDAAVPTGAIITSFNIQCGVANVAAAVANFFSFSIQQLRFGQLFVDPRTIGGSSQRNQVFHQSLFSVGEGQNKTWVMQFRIPKKYQRVREGDVWTFNRVGSATWSENIQVIYKFYR